MMSIFRRPSISDSFFILSLSEVDFDQPLPPPKAAANTLKASALRAIQQWNDKFGEAYKKLSLGFNFLEKCKKVLIFERFLAFEKMDYIDM